MKSKLIASLSIISLLCIETGTGHADDYWSAPYYHKGYSLLGPWPSPETAISMWWVAYQKVWSRPSCTFQRTRLTPSDSNDGAIYLLSLSNGCTGGNGIFATKRDYIPEKNFGPPQTCSKVGNPINSLTGLKYQEADDKVSRYLRFRRYFNGSDAVASSNIGNFWRHEYSYQISYLKDTTTETATVFRPNGLQVKFIRSGSQWTPDLKGKGTLSDIKDAVGNIVGWEFLDAQSKQHEMYSSSGLIKSLARANGETITFNYSDNSTPADVAPQAGLPIKVTDNKGNYIEISYNSTANVKQVKSDAGKIYAYSYNSTGNLISVQYPDGTSTQYLYNEPAMISAGTPNSLTGIIDQNGVRSASWKYDKQGRGISSEHAGGADKVTLVYNADGSTTVTNEYGKKTNYKYKVLDGLKLLTAVEGEPTANCPASNSSFTYDAQGLMKTRTDAKGNVTTYDYNDRGLETSRTEASGTPQARTVTTEWHPSLYLKTKVTEPDRITTYQYDAQGRQTGQTVTPR
ncbi:DUF6531 domain-containing protein [Pseudomonas nitroreducens]|nr:DUF6531 domain-containing protein [Pseudomonas nitroreducens]